MYQRVYLLICAIAFLCVAVAHLSRLIMGWGAELAGWIVPHWASVPGLIITATMSIWGFRLASRAGSK